MKYRVRIILDELEIEADSQEEAEEMATDIMYGDARTHLDNGFAIAGFETEVDEDEEGAE